MFYTPKLQTQLNDGTPSATRNCAVHGISMAADGGTSGAVVPSVEEVRESIGDPRDPQGKQRGLYTHEYVEALDALLPADVPVEDFAEGEDAALLRELLPAGWGLALAIDYELIPKQYSGQPTFDGNHCIYVSGWRWLDGERKVRVRDPLYDGRCKSWGCAPNGPLLVPLRIILAAAGGFAGAGRVAGAGVLRAER